MIIYKEVHYLDRDFIMANYEDKLCYFGLKEHAFIDFKKDFPNVTPVFSETGFEEFENELKLYEQNKLKEFKTELYISGTPFQKSVYKELKKVPYGNTISYSELAKRAGNEKGVRAVANAVGRNRHTIIMPCHRIIAKDGSIGGFSSGLDLKRILMNIEGIEL